MFQEPQGPGRGRQSPTPQTPLGDQSAPITFPRLPDLNTTSGEDSPPIYGVMQAWQGPPPEPPPEWEFPAEMPADPVEQEAIIKRLEQQLQLLKRYQDYQFLTELDAEVQRAPRMADRLLQSSMYGEQSPEAYAAYDSEIESLKPFLPPSLHEHVSTSMKRTRQFSRMIPEYEKRVRKAVSEKLSPFAEADLSQLTPEQSKKVEEQVQKFASERLKPEMSEEQRAGAILKARKRFGRNILKTGDPTSGPWLEGIGSSIGIGLMSPIREQQSIDDEFYSVAREVGEDMIAERGLEPDEGGFKLINRMARRKMGGKPDVVPNELPGIDAGVYRALFAQEAKRLVPELKRPTVVEDVVSGAASVAGWAVPAAAEFRMLEKGFRGLKFLGPLAGKLPKTEKLVKHIATYMVGPGAIEGLWGVTRDLPPSDQVEVDAIENPERKASLEYGLRLWNGTRDAATAVLFGAGDLGPAFRGKKVHPGRAAAWAVGTGAAAPGILESVEDAEAWVADQMRTGNTGMFDVMHDLDIARGRFKPLGNLLTAIDKGEGVGDALLDYGKAALPVAAGIGAVHGLHATGAKLYRRVEAMQMRKRAYADVDKMVAAGVEEGTIQADHAEEVRATLRKRTNDIIEAASPDEKADKQRAYFESLDEMTYGKAEQHAAAERAAQETSPDKAESLTEEKAAVREAEARATTTEEVYAARQRAEVVHELEEAKRTDDPAEAAVHREVARSLAERVGKPEGEKSGGTVRPLDEVAQERAVQEAADRVDRPEVALRALEAADADLRREWDVVSRDDDAGTVTLRDADNTNILVDVKREDLPNYRLAERGEEVRPVAPNAEGWKMPDWLRENMLATGRNPDRMFNDIDAGRKGFKDIIRKDPLFEKMSPELQERALRGDLSADEYRAERQRQSVAKPEPLQADVVPDRYDDAVAAAKRGQTSVRAIAGALGVSKRKAEALVNEMADRGVLQKQGHGKKSVYVEPTPEKGAPPKVQIEESRQRELDTATIFARLENHIRNIGSQIMGSTGRAKGGTTVEYKVGEGGEITPDVGRPDAEIDYEAGNADEIKNLVAEYAVLTNDRDPQAAAIGLVARLLSRFGHEHATAERLTKTFGLRAKDVKAVREAMAEIRPLADPEVSGVTTRMVRDTIDPMGIIDPAYWDPDGISTDWEAAQVRPTLNGVDAKTRSLFEDAIASGKTEEEAAVAAWEGFAEAENLPPHAFDEFADRFATRLNLLHRKLVNKNISVREEGAVEIVKLTRELSLADGFVGMLSTTERTRAMLLRVMELFSALRGFQGGDIPHWIDLPQLELSGGREKPPSRTQVAETSAQLHRRYLTEEAKRRQGESGSVPHWLTLGGAAAGIDIASTMAFGTPIITPLASAYYGMLGLHYAADKVFREAMRYASIVRRKTEPAPIQKRQSKRRSTHLAESVEATQSKKAGNLAGYASGLGSQLRSQLSNYGDPSFVLTGDKAASYAELSTEIASRVHQVFGEDSAADYKIRTWCELTGMRPPTVDSAGQPVTGQGIRTPAQEVELRNLTDSFNDVQRDVVSAVKSLLDQMRWLTANNLLPDQMHRQRQIRDLSEAIEIMEPQQRQLQYDFELAKEARRQARIEAQTLNLQGDELVNHIKPFQRKVENARKALDKQEANIAKKHAKKKSIQETFDGIRAEWGIVDRGYFPAVLNKPPLEAKALLAKKQFDEAAAVLDETGSALVIPKDTAIQELRDRLEEGVDSYVHNYAWNPVPSDIRSGHWKRRRDVLEAAGLLEQSGVRSLLHYMRDVMRMMPVSQWMERNRERLWGKRRVVTTEEMGVGKLEGTADSRAVEYDGKTYFMDGRVYTLEAQSKNGADRETFHFRSYADLKKAKANFAQFALAKKLPKGWVLSPKQKSGERVILQSHFDTKSYVKDVGGFNLLEVGKNPLLLWPTQALGDVVALEGGEMRRWHKKGGKEDMIAYSLYLQRGLKTSLGKDIYTQGESFCRALSNMISHAALGWANPQSGVREVIQQSVYTAVILGVPRTLRASSYAMEFAQRWGAAQKAMSKPEMAAAWLRDHTPQLSADGEIVIKPDAMINMLRTGYDPASHRGYESKFMDEACEDYVMSGTSEESVNQHYLEQRGDLEYGQAVFRTTKKNIVKKASGALKQVSWVWRHMAMTHGKRQSWFAAYLTAREDSGMSRKDAIHAANRFMLHQGNVSNRLSQPLYFRRWYGMLVKPLASWMDHVSEMNWRRMTQHGVKAAAGKVGNLFVTLWMLQQMASPFDKDLTRAIGGGLSEVPILGPKLSFGLRKLTAAIGLTADPSDVTGELPAWRKKLVELAEAHAPTWLTEVAVRAAKFNGWFPADLPTVPFWGTWSPYSFQVANNAWKLVDAYTSGDKQAQDYALGKVLGHIGPMAWFNAYNRVIDPVPNPDMPEYVMRRGIGTDTVLSNMPKSALARVWASLHSIPSAEGEAARLKRMYDKMVADSHRVDARNATERAENYLSSREEYMRQAESTTDPTAKAAAKRLADQKMMEFVKETAEYAKSRNMTPSQSAALTRRRMAAANQKLQLTRTEADVINAADNDIAFQQMVYLLDGNGQDAPVNRARFKRIVSIWYPGSAMDSAKKLENALKNVSTETVQKYRDAMKRASQRWNVEDGVFPKVK